MSLARQYLQDAELNRQLAEQGFVVIPWLSKEEVTSLKLKFESAHDVEMPSFYATSHHQDTDFRKSMSQAITDVLKPHADATFRDCELLGASFITKTKDESGKLQPHQDWNIVDENQYRSFNIWVPLVDLTAENGAIEVLPKSHNWVRGYRHSSIECAYRQVHDLVWENMKPLYLKAGQALIYDHALLHASTANQTNEWRTACASGIIPAEAQMYFYWNENGVVEQYESNADYFMTQNIFQKPVGLTKVDDLEYSFPVVDRKEFYQFIGKEMPEKMEPIPETENHIATQTETRSFWKVYTPMNILREIHFRLTSKNG